MSKHFILTYFLIAYIVFYSCKENTNVEQVCQDNFNSARELSYRNPDNPLDLDSALYLVNQSMHCDSHREAKVDLKIRLLISLRKFKAGYDFIDSLEVSDFPFPYKQRLLRDNFQALEYASKNDGSSQERIGKQSISYLEDYISTQNPGHAEFHEAYIDLYSMKRQFIDSLTISREVDSLLKEYPEDADFFNFLKH